MPEFQRKVTKFTHRGMSWTHPVDAIPEGQLCYGRNIRVTQQDTITQRPGLTNFATYAGGLSFIHSLSVLNNYNFDLVNFTKVYIQVGNTTAGPPDVNKFYVGSSAANLTSTATVGPLSQPINPVLLPNSGFTSYSPSGNPVTFVDMAPVATNIGWKYVGDSAINCSFGYYPGDSTNPGSGPNKGMARALTMGMTPPTTPPSSIWPFNAGSGPLLGSYQWCFAYRNKYTGARSNPSAPTRWHMADQFLTFPPGSPGFAQFGVPQTPIDPQTGTFDQNIVVDIYRYGGTLPSWHYIGTQQGGATFQDNIPDANIVLSPGFSTVTDPIPGAEPRPNLYRPFVMQSNAKYSTGATGTMSRNTGTSNTWILTAGGGDTFDLNWLQNSPIGIDDTNFHIYQVTSPTQLELVEDATGILVTGTGYNWAIPTGNLVAGQPLEHIWGPYGTGSGGAYIFGCGGSGRGTLSMVDAGTLYWTNGNDPDSSDVANSLVVTSPSEPLMGGCIYDGTPYVFSTERMFRIYPGALAGQFTTQEVPGGKGIWAEYSLTVQSNAIADQSISWVGKDGIYDWSASTGLLSLTDRDLYPFFPHDNQFGQTLAQIFPFITEPNVVLAPDFNPVSMRYHRLCWFQGELFYDFPSGGTVHFSTLVFDTKNTKGWVSLDQYSNGVNAVTTKPVARGIEIAANNLKVAVGQIVLDYTGTTDGGTTIPCRVFTRQDDLGDVRAQKLWGDYMFDAASGSSTITITPLTSYAAASGPAQTFAIASRSQVIYTTATTGLGVLAISFGFDIIWNVTATPTVLYQYEITFVQKPPLTGKLATDKTDDGYNGAKYLRGLCIESDTFGNDRTVNVLVDGATAATLTVNSAGQLEKPFAITPLAGSEFQLQPTDGVNLWELYAVRWVWEKWPDLTVIQSNWLDMGTTKPKYVRAFTIPVSGPASPTLSFTLTYDGSSTYTTAAVAPASITAKSPAQYSINPPILAHQLKLTPSTACRVWYEEIRWDAEEWPELTALYGPVDNLGTSGAKYLRGFELPIETNGSSAVMWLYYDNQPTSTTGVTNSQSFPAVTTTPLSKNVFPYTPVTPVVAHVFQLRSSDPARYWYNEVKWEFEPWPENDTGAAAWTDMGDPGVKFLQGLVIPMDTNGLPVSFTLHYDNGQTAPIGPFTTPSGSKTAMPWSFPVPLVVHEVQITPNSTCRFWDNEIKWIWEPMPELVTTYTTQPTDHDVPGYHYLFDAYIAYIGSTDAPLFTVTTEYGSVTYTLPIANGTYNRAYVLCQPQKAKWHSYSITSTNGIRLYFKDCEVRVKNWTDKGNYPSAFTSRQPFGEASRIYGARI